MAESLSKLDAKLLPYGLRRKTIAGDGNCLFRSILEGMQMDQKHHHQLRLQCVAHMKEDKATFEAFLPSEEADVLID
eukprot:5410986-Prorocentrum_lima.AAC.1